MLLKTGRLVLRRACASDLDAMHAIMADAETMKYWSSLPHADRQVTWRLLLGMILGPASDSDTFLIEHAGSVIGKVGIWRESEVGFILAQAFWGKGLARESLAAFIDYAFEHVTDHLTAEVDPRNTASLGLLRRLGFVETRRAERTWNIAGVWSDSVYLHLESGRGCVQAYNPDS